MELSVKLKDTDGIKPHVMYDIVQKEQKDMDTQDTSSHRVHYQNLKTNRLFSCKGLLVNPC